MHILTEEEWMGLLPDDDAKVLVVTYCAMCHSLKNAVLGARDRDQWLGTIEKMVQEYSAPIDAVDAELIADYLGKYSGPDNPIAVLPLDLDSVSAAALDRLPFLTDAEVEAVVKFLATEVLIEDVAELRTVLSQDKLAKLRRYVTAR